MEQDPMAWLAMKRGPIPTFDEQADKYGFHKWASEVRTLHLDATAAYVLGEQTVKAAELNDTLEYTKVFYWIRNKCSYQSRSMGLQGYRYNSQIYQPRGQRSKQNYYKLNKIYLNTKDSLYLNIINLK